MLHEVREPVTIETRLDDGVRLVADIYRPVGLGLYPVLLMRQPYGRRIASTVVLAHPAWYAAQGYVVMLQDVRGRGDSGGQFAVLSGDAADGAATLAAAAGLAGGDGRVATYGFSYHGMTQFMGLAGALKSGGPKPAAMAVAMAAWNVRDDWAFEGGAFRLEGNQLWALQMAAENARIAGNAEAYNALRAASGRLASGPIPARLDALEAWRPFTHYHSWLADDPATWQASSPHAALAGHALDVPTLHIGGWLDLMLPGTFAAYSAFAVGGARTELRIGPWAHLPWGRRVGAFDAGLEAGAGVDETIVRFFDHVLKDHPPDDAPIALFDLGLKTYRRYRAPPETEEFALYLTSSGRAAPTVTDGRLGADLSTSAADRLVHDPWRPAPSHGLALGSPGGYQPREAIDDRGDVAAYTSAPLERELSLSGPNFAEIHVASDRPSFDLAAILSVVDDDGVALAIAGGYQRTPAETGDGPVRVDLRRTCMTLPAGRRLRLSLQASAWPAFMINPGTGVRPEDAALAECLVTTLVIRHGASHPSRLILSVIG